MPSRRSPAAPTFTLAVTLPWSPYAVPCGRKGEHIVSLAKNAQLRAIKGSDGRITMAKNQAWKDAFQMTKKALGDAGWPVIPLHLMMDAVIVCKVARARDDDGAIVALWSVRDGIAQALEINDHGITTGRVTFARGEQEETRITLKEAR